LIVRAGFFWLLAYEGEERVMNPVDDRSLVVLLADLVDERDLVDLLDDVGDAFLVVPRIGPLVVDVGKELGVIMPLRALAIGLEIRVVHCDTRQELLR